MHAQAYATALMTDALSCLQPPPPPPPPLADISVRAAALAAAVSAAPAPGISAVSAGAWSAAANSTGEAQIAYKLLPSVPVLSSQLTSA